MTVMKLMVEDLETGEIIGISQPFEMVNDDESNVKIIDQTAKSLSFSFGNTWLLNKQINESKQESKIVSGSRALLRGRDSNRRDDAGSVS